MVRHKNRSLANQLAASGLAAIEGGVLYTYACCFFKSLTPFWLYNLSRYPNSKTLPLLLGRNVELELRRGVGNRLLQWCRFQRVVLYWHDMDQHTGGHAHFILHTHFFS